MNLCNVSWEDFSKHSKEAFAKLFSSEAFTDVTLVPDDGSPIQAHRFILSSGSVVLERMLSTASHLESSRGSHYIYLPTVQHQDLLSLMEFIYCGETKIRPERVEKFFRLAADLKINTINANTNDSTSNNSSKLDFEFIEQDQGFQQSLYEETDDNNFHALISNGLSSNNDVNDLSRNQEALLDLTQVELDRDVTAVVPEDDFSENLFQFPKEVEELNNTQVNLGFDNDLLNSEDVINEKRLEVPVKKLRGRKYEYPEEMESGSTDCHECKKTFHSVAGLQLHYRSIHKKIKYPCDFCDYQGTQKCSLAKHIKAVHAKDYEICQYCPYEAPSKPEIRKHMAKHHPTNFPCTLCDFKGSIAGDLKQHIEQSHNGTKFPCEKCPYKASTPGHLEYHKKLHCQYCDKVIFSQKDSHMKIHEEEMKKRGRGRPTKQSTINPT